MHSRKEKEKYFSKGTGGKSLMSAESLLKREEKLSVNIRLFCVGWNWLYAMQFSITV